VLVQVKAELRDLGLVYQAMACTALWDKIDQISSKEAYNVPVFDKMSRYDRLGPYMSLHYLFWAVLARSVMFEHFKVKVPGERESGQK